MATSKAREKENEEYLRKTAKKHGGHADKFSSPSRRSVPDRVCDIPCFDPVTFYVEVKAEGQSPTPAQERDHERRRATGAVVYVVDSKQAVDDLFALNCGDSTHDHR